MRDRGERRAKDKAKALRKKKISDSYFSCLYWERSYYDNLHQYSKNKIHCSCYMCRMKTNNKGKNKKLYPGTKNWKHSDLIKILRLEEQLDE